MKSPAKIRENRILGNITTSTIRNLLPKSIYAKQKSIQNQQTKSLRSNDENAPPCDSNVQTAHNDLHSKTKSPQKVFSTKEEHTQLEGRSVLATRSNSMANEITEEDDQLGDQIRELKEELIRTKSDGYKLDGTKSGGYFVRESLSQLRMSINKSLVMSCDNKQDDSENDTMDDDDGGVFELNKHIDTYCDADDDLRDSVQSSFASASCCEAESNR